MYPILKHGILVALLAGATMACNDGRHRPAVDAPAVDGGAKPRTVSRQLVSYPKAKWRLAGPGELDHVVLWVSHILIRHKDTNQRAPFGVPGWDPLPPPPERTREEALALARTLARDIRAKPSDFERVARAASEDVVTSADGGSLGGISAGSLLMYPDVLDALAALQPGEVSEVVESPAGFHVLLKRSVPPLMQVAGRRIVIGYDGASWLDSFHRHGHKSLKRPRADALAAAESIAAKAREGESFDALLKRNSEHEDATQLGDIGVWSTHEPAGLEREREQLSRLEVGEISQPIDSMIGFQLYMRTDAAPRPEYAMSAVRFNYTVGAPATDQQSPTRARELAASAAKTLAEQPGRFAAFQNEYCCTNVVRWTEGREPAALTRAVADLAFGAVASSPVEVQSAFLIARRLDPTQLPDPPAVTFELPAPETPDVMAFARTARGPAVQKLVQKIRDEAPASLGLDEKRTLEFREIHDAISPLFALGPSRTDHDQALSAQFMKIHALLTEDEYGRYEKFLKDTTSALLMRR